MNNRKKYIINIKDKIIDFIKGLDDKYYMFISKLNENDLNRLAFSSAIIFSFVIFSSFYYTYKNNVLIHDIQIKKMNFELAKVKMLHEEEIEKIKTEAQKEIAKYNAKAEEARAAANPYVRHINESPFNITINTNDSSYVVGANDYRTEISISTITVKGKKYTPEQRKLMEMAFYIGKEIGFPETIQSLLLQETHAGAYGDRIGDTNLPMGKRSYGVMQMKVATARKVLKKYPLLVKKYFPNRKSLRKVRDEEIIIKLIQDDEFNIRLAALNFLIHRKASKNWAQAVVAYNTGQGKANKILEPKKHEYYIKVLNRLIKEVRPFNKEANLS